MCNCSADKSLIFKYSFSTLGVYTYVSNFSTNVCTSRGTMYATVTGMCGGESFDDYYAQRMGIYAVTTQKGSSSTDLQDEWSVNAKYGAGLFAVFLWHTFLFWAHR
jgi:hypothetical protein